MMLVSARRARVVADLRSVVVSRRRDGSLDDRKV
jgi:hypothetical protein